MTPSVTEYHFFFLTNEVEEPLPSTPRERQQPDDILQSLFHYFERGRLQTFTLSLREQFPSAEAMLSSFELESGRLPGTPRSWREVIDLPKRLLNITRPCWRSKNRWEKLQHCTLLPGANKTTRLFMRTESLVDGVEGVLIHGALFELPGAALIESMPGRQLLALAGRLLPGDLPRTALTLLSGSRVHIELLDFPDGAVGLQPFVVIKATTG